MDHRDARLAILDGQYLLVDVTKHAEGCAACRQLLATAAAVDKATATLLDAPSAPPGLADRILSGLKVDMPDPQKPGSIHDESPTSRPDDDYSIADIVSVVHECVVDWLTPMIADMERFSGQVDKSSVDRSLTEYQTTTRRIVRHLRELIARLRVDQQSQGIYAAPGPDLSNSRSLARVLHDRISALNLLLVDLEHFKSLEWDTQSARKEVAGYRETAGRALLNLLDIVRALREGKPLENDDPDLGLTFTSHLRVLLADFEARYSIASELTISDDWPSPLDGRAATHLYRVLEEALNNACRHADATQVAVSLSLSEGDRAVVSIVDDGTGITVPEPESVGFGIRGMRERLALLGGKFAITPGDSSGTEVLAVVPRMRLVPAAAPETDAGVLKPSDRRTVAAGSRSKTDRHRSPRQIRSASDRRGRRPLRVGVADDQVLFRKGLSTLMDADPRVKIVSQAADGAEAVMQAATSKAEVWLMDIRMPGVDGIEATRQIVNKHPNVKVVILTTFQSDSYVLNALKAGASGYVLKDSRVESIISSLFAVMEGERVMASTVGNRALEMMMTGDATEFYDGLTARQIEILKLLAAGMADGQIAKKLEITIKTVRSHVSGIYGKLNIYDRSQAVLYAVRKGLVEI